MQIQAYPLEGTNLDFRVVSMATRAFVQSRATVNELDNLRRTVRNLLHQVDSMACGVQIDADKGVDFYQAVERFEAELIRSALDLSGGRQNQAARLLKLRNSTLNSKMKQLKLR